MAGQARVRRLLGSLAALVLMVGLLASGVVEPSTAPLFPEGDPGSPPDRLDLVIPVYNQAGLRVALDAFRPHLQAGDSFIVVSGNNGRTLDISWLNEAAARLKDAYPDNRVLAMTSGLNNVREVARWAQPPIEGVAYVYEPNHPNAPEFSWDFPVTRGNFQQATGAIQEAGLLSLGKPTGRPVLQGYLQQYGWDYGVLGQEVDRLMVQTQTYCKKDLTAPGEYERALDQVMAQYAGQGVTRPWFPQVTVDLNSVNGVTVDQALKCARAVQDRGLAGVTLWWSPADGGDAALRFISRLSP